MADRRAIKLMLDSGQNVQKPVSECDYHHHHHCRRRRRVLCPLCSIGTIDLITFSFNLLLPFPLSLDSIFNRLCAERVNEAAIVSEIGVREKNWTGRLRL